MGNLVETLVTSGAENSPCGGRSDAEKQATEDTKLSLRSTLQAGRSKGQERTAVRERRSSDGCSYDASPGANRGPKAWHATGTIASSGDDINQQGNGLFQQQCVGMRVTDCEEMPCRYLAPWLRSCSVAVSHMLTAFNPAFPLPFVSFP